MTTATIISGEADLADVWFLIAVICAGVSFVVALMNDRALDPMFRALAVGFLALGLLFL